MDSIRDELSPLPSTMPLLVSGRNDAELRVHAGRWARWFEDNPGVSWTAALRTAAFRPHFRRRAAIQAQGAPEVIDALRALSRGSSHPGLTVDRANARSGLAFVFSGQGGQWRGMGRRLLEEVPTFADAVEEVEAALADEIEWSLMDTLLADPAAGSREADLDRFDVSLFANFAMGIGLAAAYREQGITPDVVVGYSLGELTAAVVAGALSPEQGALAVHAAGRLMVEDDQQTGMLVVGFSLERALRRVESFEGLHVGIVDGPESVVLCGELDAIRTLEGQLDAEGVFHRRVKNSGAPHSPFVSELVPKLCTRLAALDPRATTVPMVSSITGRRIEGAELDAEHWGRVLGSRVRFDEAIRTMLIEGIDTFVELGPHPLLAVPIGATCQAEGALEASVFGAMRRGQGGLASLHQSLGSLHCCGHELRWRSRIGARGEVLPLPAYSLRPAESTPRPAEALDPQALEAIVREEVAAVLHLRDPSSLVADAGVEALGLDSLAVLDLKNRIGKRVGLRLPQHFLYEHSTVEAVARALAQRLEPSSTPAPAAPLPSSPEPRSTLRTALAGMPSDRARVDAILEPLRVQVCSALGREHVDPHASLRQLGIDDVLGAELCLRIQRRMGLRVFPREIVERDSLLELADHIARAYRPHRGSATRMSLEQLDATITSPYDSWTPDGEGEAQPTSDQALIVILSPPRSGSTLLRVMLAGHSELFSPQELHLAPFETMASYYAHLHGTVLDMGFVGAIAEVISRTGSWNLYRQWVREAKPTAEVYEFFRQRIGARVLVDKSPLFFPPLSVLRRLARSYPRARFVHLVRHPVSCIGSYVQERFHGIFEQTAQLDPYDAAEWCWTRVHEGIRAFARELPSSRFIPIYFEDLATDPERVMRRLCPSLGIDFEPAVLEPYSGHRMVAGGFQVGDPNFTRHQRIVADKSQAWREVSLPRPLREPTLEIAQQLGYDTTALRPAAVGGPAADRREAQVAMGGIGMDEDVHLPEDIVVKSPYTPSSRAPRAVFLTGGTGFLGAFLLDELMRQTQAKIYCLVRARDSEHALERLRDNLGSYGLWREEHEARIVPVPGDLSQPGLGLSEAARIELVRSVDAIHHCAARVSWLQPYRNLRDVNVGGLVQVLRLACLEEPLPVHYVSSLGTAFMRPFEHREMVEWMARDSGLGTESVLELPLGYIESKWVNAKIVAKARERGVPVSLYAPGLIGGHSRSGVDSLSESQFLHALIKGSTQLGAFPDARGWRFVPVDQAARRIVRCSCLPGVRDLDLYLDSTSLIDPAQMVEVLRSYGYEVEQVPFAVWRQRVLDLADAHETDNALFGFTDVIYAFTPLRFRGQRLQMSWFLRNAGASPEAREILGDTEFVNRELLERLVGYYVRAGAMPPRPEPRGFHGEA